MDCTREVKGCSQAGTCKSGEKAEGRKLPLGDSNQRPSWWASSKGLGTGVWAVSHAP